jgi:hypothetical protein
LIGWTYSMPTFCGVSMPTFCVVMLNGRALRSFNEFDISLRRSLSFGDCLLTSTRVFSTRTSGGHVLLSTNRASRNLPKKNY